jgi:2'-5' RNA ligase
MRYVIVYLIEGEALKFHEKLTNDICSRFNVKRQRLPAHFTIKAPFETEEIDELEKLTEEFCLDNKVADIKIQDFGHFQKNVVYMDVLPSSEAIKVHDNYIDLIQTLPWLEWKSNEGKGRIFHCTLISKIPYGVFADIWAYIVKINCSFKLSFDNISILLWEKDKWNLYKQYKFKK